MANPCIAEGLEQAGGDCPSGALRQSLCQALTPGQHRAGTAFKTKKILDSGESMLCAVWQSLLLLFSMLSRLKKFWTLENPCCVQFGSLYYYSLACFQD